MAPHSKSRLPRFPLHRGVRPILDATQTCGLLPFMTAQRSIVQINVTTAGYSMIRRESLAIVNDARTSKTKKEGSANKN